MINVANNNTQVDEEIYGQIMNAMADASYFNGYSRWNDVAARYETFEEGVSRVMDMHRFKLSQDFEITKELEELIKYAEDAYKEKVILGAQRALQFGGDQLLKHNSRMFNCSASYLDRPEFFQQAMYLLMSGCGVGFSVQLEHVAKLPAFESPSQDVVLFTPDDSIEGWSDCFGVLISSYICEKDKARAPFPEYVGKTVHFDLSGIRPEGSLISGGFKAPGPEPLATAIDRVRNLLTRAVKGQEVPIKLRPIQVYDIVMHQSDAVLAGGVRRAATIAIFSLEDYEMMNAKTGNWYTENPQRARSNNSVLLIRGEISRERFHEIKESTKQFGEPGFILAADKEFLFNPCVEIGLRGYTDEGESGFQFCNLTEINGAKCSSPDVLFRAAKASAILGTIQASYTDFKYIGEASKKITDREALLGCSITGWMNNPDVLFDKETIEQAAKIIVSVNKKVAAMIGINQAARTTCVKPSGNASVLLGTASGIHPEHAPRYIRNVTLNRNSEVLQKIMLENPDMVAPHNASPTDFVVSFTLKPKAGSICKDDVTGVEFLSKVKHVQDTWVAAGKVKELCVDERLDHNVSNTVTVDDWDAAFNYIYDNQNSFAGVSLLSSFGDKAYNQAPFIAVLDAAGVAKKYGNAGIFASGLIVDGLYAYNDDLWAACSSVYNTKEIEIMERNPTSRNSVKRDWIRRVTKFANKHFGGSLDRAVECLKDIATLKQWDDITKNFTPMDFAGALKERSFTDVNTMGAQACSGGSCEIDVM